MDEQELTQNLTKATETLTKILAETNKAVSSERINPFTLYPDLVEMHEAGTLAAALGEVGAERLLHSTAKACADLADEDAKQSAQAAKDFRDKWAASVQMQRKTVRWAAVIVVILLVLLWLK
jgi:hypothetical protein